MSIRVIDNCQGTPKKVVRDRLNRDLAIGPVHKAGIFTIGKHSIMSYMIQ